MKNTTSIEIFDTLHEMLRIYRAQIRKKLEASDYGLSFSEFRVLMFIGQNTDCSQKKLVSHSHTDKAQMTRTLNQMKEKGWLIQSKSTIDRRVHHLNLSPYGQKVFLEFKGQRLKLTNQLLASCQPDMQKQLLELLKCAKGSAVTAKDTCDKENLNL